MSHMTISGSGYVRWHATPGDPGVVVEHYSGSLIEDTAAQAAELAKDKARADHLAALGIPVTLNRVIFFHDWFADLQPGDPYLKLLAHVNHLIERDNATRDWALFYETDDGGALVLVCEGGLLHEEVDDSRDFDLDGKQWGYHEYRQRGWRIAQLGQGEKLGVCYATRAQVIAWLQARHISPDVLKDHGVA